MNITLATINGTIISPDAAQMMIIDVNVAIIKENRLDIV